MGKKKDLGDDRLEQLLRASEGQIAGGEEWRYTEALLEPLVGLGTVAQLKQDWNTLPAEGKAQMPLCATLFALGGLSATTWGRFQAIYLEQKGLGEEQIGMIAGITPICQAIAVPMWGVLADKLKNKKGVFLFTKVANTAVLSLLAFPALACYDCFAPILLITTGVAILASGGILDAWALDIMGEEGSKIWYGRVRMCTAVSWGLGALAMGLVNDATGSFNGNFIIYGVLAVLSVLIFAFLIPDKTSNEEQRDTLGQTPQVADLFAALLRPPVLLFFLEVFVFGMCIGAVESLLFVYLKRDLLATTTLCGVSVAVSVIFEIPIFFYAGQLLAWLGPDRTFCLAYLFHGCRCFLYTLLTPETVWWVLAPEVLHGFCFSLMWSGAVEKARQIAPKGWEATMQTLLNTLYYSMAMGAGGLVGGFVMSVPDDLCDGSSMGDEQLLDCEERRRAAGKHLYQLATGAVFCLLGLRLIAIALSAACPGRRTAPFELPSTGFMA